MIDDSINLLEELDNVSRIHVLDRDDIDQLMIEFARRILVTLKIERVNVWVFNQERDAIISIGEYDSRTHKFSKNSVLYKKDFPAYFEAIKENRIILAPNIHTHPATFQFTDSYSKPNDILSLMDVPLRMEGELIGVICFEKTGKTQRIFSEKEQTFALSISTVLASNLEARHRRAAQHKLESALKEKDLLIQEINHRVKNNFSILISLLRLSRAQGKTTSPELLLEEYEQRIFSMLKIHELLYQTKNYTSVNLSDYVNELLKEFKNSHPEVAPHLHTEINHREGDIHSKTAIHLGLVITEVLLNAVKHSFGKSNDFSLSITMKEVARGKMTLSISGPGNNFDFASSLQNSSMGLHLVKSLCEDMNLECEYPSAGKPVYAFTFNTTHISTGS